MKKTKNFVQSVVDDITTKDGKMSSIDPVMVMLILEIVLETIKLIQMCMQNRSTEEALESCKEPNMLQRGLLKRLVKKSFPENEPLTNAITSAIINKGGELSRSEIEEILNEQIQDDKEGV